MNISHQINPLFKLRSTLKFQGVDGKAPLTVASSSKGPLPKPASPASSISSRQKSYRQAQIEWDEQYALELDQNDPDHLMAIQQQEIDELLDDMYKDLKDCKLSEGFVRTGIDSIEAKAKQLQQDKLSHIEIMKGLQFFQSKIEEAKKDSSENLSTFQDKLILMYRKLNPSETPETGSDKVSSSRFTSNGSQSDVNSTHGSTSSKKSSGQSGDLQHNLQKDRNKSDFTLIKRLKRKVLFEWFPKTVKDANSSKDLLSDAGTDSSWTSETSSTASTGTKRQKLFANHLKEQQRAYLQQLNDKDRLRFELAGFYVDLSQKLEQYGFPSNFFHELLQPSLENHIKIVQSYNLSYKEILPVVEAIHQMALKKLENTQTIEKTPQALNTLLPNISDLFLKSALKFQAGNLPENQTAEKIKYFHQQVELMNYFTDSETKTVLLKFFLDMNTKTVQYMHSKISNLFTLIREDKIKADFEPDALVNAIALGDKGKSALRVPPSLDMQPILEESEEEEGSEREY